MEYRKVYRTTLLNCKTYYMQDLVDGRSPRSLTAEEAYQDALIMSSRNYHDIKISVAPALSFDRSNAGQKALELAINNAIRAKSGIILADITCIYPHSYMAQMGRMDYEPTLVNDFMVYNAKRNLIFATGHKYITEGEPQEVVEEISLSRFVEYYPYKTVSKKYDKLNKN